LASKFDRIAAEIGKLTTEKNVAYGDSYNRACNVLKELYPNGVEPYQYRDMLATVRVIDKLFRIATRKDAFGESPWRDICGYSLLGIAADEVDPPDEKLVKKHAELQTNLNLAYDAHDINETVAVPENPYADSVARNRQSKDISDAVDRHNNTQRYIERENAKNVYVGTNIVPVPSGQSLCPPSQDHEGHEDYEDRENDIMSHYGKPMGASDGMLEDKYSPGTRGCWNSEETEDGTN
tara:strand:- start:351 stop:1061 length:711 start_codon:yes stop_codon:yes gene_type:complete